MSRLSPEDRTKRMARLLAKVALRVAEGEQCAAGDRNTAPRTAAAAGDQVEAEEPSADDRDEVLKDARGFEARDGGAAR